MLFNQSDAECIQNQDQVNALCQSISTLQTSKARCIQSNPAAAQARKQFASIQANIDEQTKHAVSAWRNLETINVENIKTTTDLLRKLTKMYRINCNMQESAESSNNISGSDSYQKLISLRAPTAHEKELKAAGLELQRLQIKLDAVDVKTGITDPKDVDILKHTRKDKINFVEEWLVKIDLFFQRMVAQEEFNACAKQIL
jgi:hypothetical protein